LVLSVLLPAGCIVNHWRDDIYLAFGSSGPG